MPTTETTASDDDDDGSPPPHASPPPECLLFPTKFGFFTKTLRDSFLQSEIDQGRMPPDCLEDEAVTSLNAVTDDDDDEERPLFFWQLYSLMGRERIQALVTLFYDSVFDDNHDWFRAIFQESSSKKYHITAQSVMYVDSFGGGKLYYGAQRRLDIHHSKTRAIDILNTQGATRWAHHMRKALDEMEQAQAFCPQQFAAAAARRRYNHRIRIALNTFLTFMMEKYGRDYEFDASSIYFGETYPARP